VISNAASSGLLLLGGLLAFAVPLLTRPSGRTRRASSGHGWHCASRRLRGRHRHRQLACRVAGDRPAAPPVAGFRRSPARPRDPFLATLLASVVSLTPGTVAIDVDRQRWVLLVHALDAPDPQALVREIKARYELPLKEMFAC
jgi:hypothetical protein